MVLLLLLLRPCTAVDRDDDDPKIFEDWFFESPPHLYAFLELAALVFETGQVRLYPRTQTNR